jgi:hypothetical protein
VLVYKNLKVTPSLPKADGPAAAVRRRTTAARAGGHRDGPLARGAPTSPGPFQPWRGFVGSRLPIFKFRWQEPEAGPWKRPCARLKRPNLPAVHSPARNRQL